jgi:hypothetical protein
MAELYEVFSPWADIDPVPVRGIAPRLAELHSKTIGLFDNGKRAARPMLAFAERKIKDRIPDIQFKWYQPSHKLRYSTVQIESENKAEFLEWLNQVDGIIAAVGD